MADSTIKAFKTRNGRPVFDGRGIAPDVNVMEPELAKVGGVWDEPFILPVDPELLFQRTGYACMDEVGFPLNSVDSEETAVFYDQECVAQGELSKTECHQTALPKDSCVDALDKSVGKIETKVHFERLPWDKAVAEWQAIEMHAKADGNKKAVIL